MNINNTKSHINIFITGASIGIGEYVAYEYAKQGATIGLAARRKDLLQTVAKKCKELGGIPIIYELNVIDQKAVKKTIDDFIAIACYQQIFWGSPIPYFLLYQR
jgi:NADP-dependent 3-hydroxy acid dehydrogenase YdfG